MSEKPTYEELEQRIRELEKAEYKRKQFEDELQNTENILQSIFDAAPVGICIMKNRVYQRANRDWCERFGYHEKNIIGRTTAFLYESLEEYERVGNELYAALINNGIAFARTRLKHSDGKFRDVDLIAKPLNPNDLESGTVVVIHDITERKRAEEALHESERKYRDLFELSPVGIFQTSAKGQLLFVNPEMTRFIGANSPEEAVEKLQNVARDFYVDSNRRKTFIDLLKDRGVVKNFEFEARRLDGQHIWLSMNASAREMSSDGMFLINGFITDVTDRKRAEEEKVQLEAKLLQAQKMEAIGTLAGGIAHDFNNILSAVIGYTELSQMSISPESNVSDHLDKILKAGNRAKDLVQQILTFSRQTEHELKPVSVKLIAKEALKLLRASLPSTIEICATIENDSLVIGDPTQIHQILMNLCTNAYHAMEETGGRLEVSLKDVTLQQGDLYGKDLYPGSYNCLTVSDTGIGMEKKILERIFEPYFTTKETGKGTGLGLSIIYGIVKKHHGDIQVCSEPGRGTVFQVYLPMIKDNEKIETSDEDTPIPKGTERILLVDDEEFIVQMDQLLLESLGYSISAQKSSTDALNTFRAAPHNFDLVITDMTMPNMTGTQLSLELKKIRPDIPIILCTGFSEQIDAEKISTLGIKGFLAKPVLRIDFAKMVRKVLDEVKG